MSNGMKLQNSHKLKTQDTGSLGMKRLDYEREVLPHVKALQRAARNLTSNEMDAQDLVQDTLLRAHRYWHSYKVGSNCGAWLYRILKNTFISEHRVWSRRPPLINLDDLHDADYFNLPDRGRLAANPEDIFQLTIIKLDVAAALARLSHEFRQALLQYFWGGLSYRDIASAADLPLSTVRARMYRGKQLLRDQLGC